MVEIKVTSKVVDGLKVGFILKPKKKKQSVDDLFTDRPNGKYHYNGGFNQKGMIAWILSGYIAVGSVWPNILPGALGDFFANLGGGGGYSWMIGAALGAIVHLAISNKK